MEWSGHGPPLLLLHGFTGDTTSWRSLATSLDNSFTVIRVDLPGHGRSTAIPDPARYHLPRLTADLSLVLHELGYERAAVLGYSLGGRAALRLALDFPERVGALVLESTSAGIRDPAERSRRAAEDSRLADDIERDGIPAFVDRWERLPIWESQRWLSSAARGELRAQRLRADPVGLANSLRGAGAGVTRPVHDSLGSIRCRTLLVVGELDSKYVMHANEMAAAIPTVEIRTVPSTGHAVHLERPAEFAELVRDFLGG